MEPPTDRAREICERDMHDLVAAACQAIDRSVLSPDVAPEVANQMVLTDIIETRYDNLSSEETEAVRQDLAARMNILTLARREASRGVSEEPAEWVGPSTAEIDDDLRAAPNALLALVRRFINVRDLDIDLIDSVNTFREQFEITSKSLDSTLLSNMQSAMVAMRVQMTEDEARTLWPRIKRFLCAGRAGAQRPRR